MTDLERALVRFDATLQESRRCRSRLLEPGDGEILRYREGEAQEADRDAADTWATLEPTLELQESKCVRARTAFDTMLGWVEKR